MTVRFGVTRLVVLVGPYALKFPHPRSWKRFLHGLLANMQEATFGRAGWPELCPVRFALPGGWLLVMQRVEPCTEDDGPTEDEFRRLTQHEDYCVPAEWKAGSWGRTKDGRLVAIDYG